MRPLPKTLARLKSVAERMSEIQVELAKPSPIPVNHSEVEMATKAKKVVKKATKKVVKKAAATDSDVVTLAELAEAAGISPQRARQKLREAEFKREGRWTWPKGDKAIAKVEEILASGKDEE